MEHSDHRLDQRGTLVADVEKRFQDGPRVTATLEIPADPASVSILFGPSGAGKTTLLRCIAGLESLTRGRIRYGNEIWADAATGKWIPPQKRRTGYLFQDYALFPHLTVAANIAFGLGRMPRAEKTRQVHSIAGRLGLDLLLERWPRQLSGGEQQRVALARVLIRQPRVLLLDEPFAALDSSTREEVRAYVSRLLRQLSIPAIVVTHDWVDALTLGDRMIVIDRGHVLQEGTPREVLTKPAGPDVAALAGVETIARGEVRSRQDGTLTLAVGSSNLVAIDPGGVGTSFWVSIRGEDVVLEKGTPVKIRARNHLKGRVVELVPKGVLTKIVLDVGFPLVALVTRQAALDLDLTPGGTVSAVFKASIVHLIPRVE
jgi:molybdate transport system ATP-binding protein